MYGLHRAISNQRNVLVLRACFFAQWRAQRNAAINGHDNAVQRTWSTMNQRLRAGILRDWSVSGFIVHKTCLQYKYRRVLVPTVQISILLGKSTGTFLASRVVKKQRLRVYGSSWSAMSAKLYFGRDWQTPHYISNIFGWGLPTLS